jgi:hypothetical protein
VRTSALRKDGGTRINKKGKAVLNEKEKRGNQMEKSSPPLIPFQRPPTK